MRNKKWLLAASLAFVLFSSCEQGLPKGRILDVEKGDIVVVPKTFTDPHSFPLKMRVLGIRCPDNNSKFLEEAYFGSLAIKRVQQWSKKRLVVLERPVMRSETLPDKKFGFVRDSKTGEYLHEVLLREGLARSDFQGRDYGDKNQRILDLEKEAQTKELGMWAKKLPAEHVMRAEVNDSSSLMKQLRNSLSSKTSERITPFGEEKPRPQSQPKSEPQPETKPRPPVKVAVRVSEDKSYDTVAKKVNKAHSRYKEWEKAAQAERLATAHDLRRYFRHVRIQIMDLKDEQEDKLSQEQLDSLKQSQVGLEKLNKSVKDYVSSK